MKSLRGSDPDAALPYLARFLEAGDLITPCRRLLCSASEDIGMAYPQAVVIVKACVDAAMAAGPAGGTAAPGPSRCAACHGAEVQQYLGWDCRRLGDVKAGRTGVFPESFKTSTRTPLVRSGEQGYLYPHNFTGHWVRQQYLPDALKDVVYYQYGDNKTEQAARTYWEKIKGQ